MTTEGKLRALSVLAGVISLFFGICLVTQLFGFAYIAYLRWSIARSAEGLGLVVGSQVSPHITVGHLLGMAAVGTIAYLAYWCRKRLRQRMDVERNVPCSEGAAKLGK
jgi:hypothetical protein